MSTMPTVKVSVALLCAALVVACAGTALAGEPTPQNSTPSGQAISHPGKTASAIPPVPQTEASRKTPESRFDNTNVILVTLQCLRPDHMGMFGYRRDTTPNLDRLAKSSVVFENSIANANLTPIAMMAALTGQYPRVNGMVAFDVTRDSVSARTMPEILKYYGYSTAAVLTSPEFFLRFDSASGKMINLRDVFSRPFDEYITSHRRGRSSLRVIPTESLNWLRQNKGKKFFLWIGTGNMHPPYAATVPEPDKSMYDPPGYTPFWEKYFPVTGNEGGPGDPSIDILMRIWRGDYYMGFKPVHHLTPDDVAYITGRYDAGVHYADKFVGNLMDTLKQTGLLKNTIVIFYSVHGKALGEHKTFINYDLQESVLKNALIIRFPDGRYAGRRITDQVQGIDLLPTLLSYLDIPIAADQQGTDLMPLIRGEAGAGGDKYVFIDRIPWWEHWMSRYFLDYKFHDNQLPNHPPSEDKPLVTYEDMLRKAFPPDSYPPGDIAVRTKQWKLVVRKYPQLLEKVSWFRFLTGKKIAVPTVELYDLAADPLETHNVAAKYPKVVAALKAKLTAWDAGVEKRKASYRGTGEKRLIIPYP